MERIAKLEAQMEAVRDRLGRVEVRLDRIDTRLDAIDTRVQAVAVDLASVKENVRHLPTKEFIVKVVLGALAVIGGLVIFQTQIQTLFGLAKSLPR